MSNTEFASASLTAGQLNAIVKKLGGSDAALKFLRGELTVSEPVRSWEEREGVIYFSITSDGTTGPQWIERLEGRGFRIGACARQLLMSDDFKPTTGVTSQIAVLKEMLFEASVKSTREVRAEAEKRKLTKPEAEVACLIRENFTDEEIEAMGLIWIVAMHEPIKNSIRNPHNLAAGRGDGGRGLAAGYSGSVCTLCLEVGFAFVVSQIGPQT